MGADKALVAMNTLLHRSSMVHCCTGNTLGLLGS